MIKFQQFIYIFQSKNATARLYKQKMSFVICEKHKKVQKLSSKVITNGYVCMNRYCPESFKVLCATCKNDHRDHANKLLSIQDTTFLLQRLLKLPFREPNKYIGETLDIMKKLKLIKQFRKKIDILEKEIQKQALKLIESTQSLVSQYNTCKDGVANLSTILSGIEQQENYNYFHQNSQQLLSNLDYNFKKDKLQYGNTLTKQKQDKRRKTLQSAKRKIEEVRDYSMKIIQVILHNGESDEEEEDFNYQKKHYQVLKNELCLQKDQNELEQEISELKNSKSTSSKSRIKKASLDQESQTLDCVKDPELFKQMENKIKGLQQQRFKSEQLLKMKLNTAIQEKQNLSQQLKSWKGKFQEKRKVFKELEISLRQNKIQRSEKQRTKDELVKKMVDLWQGKNSHSDDRQE